MDFLPRLGVLLVCGLLGGALIYWSTSFSAFNGVLGLLEEFLPEGLRNGLRRVVNSLFGLLLIGIGLVVFFLAGNSATQPQVTGNVDKASVAAPAANSSTTKPEGSTDASAAPATPTDNAEKPASSN